MSLQVKIHKRLKNFTLSVDFETASDQPEILGMLGASGCGKSYTLKCIAGIETPDYGRIVLDGVTLFDSERGIDLPPQKRQVGYLFQNYALFPNMTVRQNILCGLCREKGKAIREHKLNRALELLQLEEVQDHRPYQLSGGQAQRVALGRILVNGPRLLMLDEPFSALDSHLRDKLQFRLRQILADFQKTVLLVTHSRDEAYHLCQRIAVMEEGHLLALKNTKELFADPGSICAATLTGCKNIAAARKIGENKVEVPDWGICLESAVPVMDNIKAVGIRAHYFNASTSKNCNAVEYVSEMEEPFESVVTFRWKNQSPQAAPLWWRLPKDRKTLRFPAELGIAPANVLLLYQ